MWVLNSKFFCLSIPNAGITGIQHHGYIPFLNPKKTLFKMLIHSSQKQSLVTDGLYRIALSVLTHCCVRVLAKSFLYN